MVVEIGVGFGLWLAGILSAAGIFALVGIPLYPLVWLLKGETRMMTGIGWNAVCGAIHFFLHFFSPLAYLLSLPAIYYIYRDTRIFALKPLPAVAAMAFSFGAGAGVAWLIDLTTGFGLLNLIFKPI